MTDPRTPIFSAVKAAGGTFPSQAAVEDFHAALDRRGVPRKAGTGLADEGTFFSALRNAFGPLEQIQVDGFNFLLSAIGAAGWPVSWAAYALATAWHETNKTMQPVEEAYYLGSKAEAHRKRLRYYPWHGRGYVQLTWERNYKAAKDALGIDFTGKPELAMDAEAAARVMVWGMETGAFTSRKLADYLPKHGPADHRQFVLARYIINGTDAAAKIAGEAVKFQNALALGGWA